MVSDRPYILYRLSILTTYFFTSDEDHENSVVPYD